MSGKILSRRNYTLIGHIIFFLIFSLLPTMAELPAISRFDKITQDDGLSSNHVLCIFQEKAGWMWIGTNLGLSRYDGYHFTAYKSDISESGSLKGELVRCIYEDRSSWLWVGTERGGINYRDADKQAFIYLSVTYGLNELPNFWNRTKSRFRKLFTM